MAPAAAALGGEVSGGTAPPVVADDTVPPGTAWLLPMSWDRARWPTILDFLRDNPRHAAAVIHFDVPPPEVPR